MSNNNSNLIQDNQNKYILQIGMNDEPVNKKNAQNIQGFKCLSGTLLFVCYQQTNVVHHITKLFLDK